MRRSRAITLPLLIASMTSSCSDPPATGLASPTPLGSTLVTPSAGPSPQSPGPLPSLPDIPAGLPVMPGAEVADPDPGVIARWRVRAIGPTVYQYYLDALPAAGFAIRGRYPGGNAAIVRFAVPDGATLDLALVGEGEGARTTRIDLLLPDQ